MGLFICLTTCQLLKWAIIYIKKRYCRSLKVNVFKYYYFNNFIEENEEEHNSEESDIDDDEPELSMSENEEDEETVSALWITLFIFKERTVFIHIYILFVTILIKKLIIYVEEGSGRFKVN